jgi:hypothetical protein
MKQQSRLGQFGGSSISNSAAEEDSNYAGCLPACRQTTRRRKAKRSLSACCMAWVLFGLFTTQQRRRG